MILYLVQDMKNVYSYLQFINKNRKFFLLFGEIFMRLKIIDILFTYIFAKTEKMKSLNLQCNDYCLCIEIPYKVKTKI